MEWRGPRRPLIPSAVDSLGQPRDTLSAAREEDDRSRSPRKGNVGLKKDVILALKRRYIYPLSPSRQAAPPLPSLTHRSRGEPLRAEADAEWSAGAKGGWKEPPLPPLP